MSPSFSRTNAMQIEHIRSLYSNIYYIYLLALLFRIPTLIFKFLGFPYGWGGEMASVALSLANGDGFSSPYWQDTGPTALVPPVYPLLLAGIFKIFGGYTVSSGITALVINLFLSSLICIPIYLLGKKVISKDVGLIAAWLWVIYPLTGFSDVINIWNTTLYTLLLTTFVYFSFCVNKNYKFIWLVYYGFLGGITILVEPACLSIVPLITLWICVNNKIGVKKTVYILMTLLLLPMFWSARNILTFKQAVFLRSGSGLQLYYGVTGNEFSTDERTWKIAGRDPDEFRIYENLGEIEYMKEKRRKALELIYQNPYLYTKKIIRRIGAFWYGTAAITHQYWFYYKFKLVKHILFFIPALLGFIGLYFLFRRDPRKSVIFSIIMFIYPAVYYFVMSEPRYRLPIEPILIVLSAISISTIFKAAKEKYFWLLLKNKY